MFLGRNSLNETARALLWQCEREGMTPVLRFVPKCCADALDTLCFSVIDEPDQFDYIVSTSAISAYEGQSYRLQRNFVRRFTELHSALQFREVDLKSVERKAQIKALIATWAEQKERDPSDVENENAAITRCLDAFEAALIGNGIFDGEKLVAFALCEDVGNGYGVNHFEKAATTVYTGIVPYFRQKTAQALRERGIEYVNLEQDLGIPGLRQSKRSYAPVAFLKKYRVAR